ncbi:MAG: S41 family peptidase [Candidatus Komeilibacteria bacterium]
MNEIKYNFPSVKKRTTTVVIVLILVSFGFGWLVGNGSAIANSSDKIGTVYNQDKIPSYLSKDVNFNLFWQIWDLVKNKYVYRDKINDIDLFYGAMAGSVAALGDPYSVFFNPEVAGKFTKELSGKFEGIGAEIGIKNNTLTIIAPLPDTPADKAGVRAGDKILAIDGLDTTGMSTDQAVNLIRGEKDTPVVLTILHKEELKTQDIQIIRDTINIISVQWEMKDDNIAYIRVTHFNEDTGKRFKQAVNELLQQNAQRIILDLRNNPGGFLDVAIELGGYWVDHQVMVKEVFYNTSRNQDYVTSGMPLLADIPTIVLVNGGSASASEILAGALQDYGLATLLGETTFGKGSVQELEQLSDGSAVKITVAEWHTPKDRVINNVGIEPDKVVEFNEEDYNNDIDNQLDAALQAIKQLP